MLMIRKRSLTFRQEIDDEPNQSQPTLASRRSQPECSPASDPGAQCSVGGCSPGHGLVRKAYALIRSLEMVQR